MRPLIAFIAGFLVVSTTGRSCDQDRKPESSGISIEESIYFPVGGCENGQPVSNVELPVRGGPQLACVNRGKSSSLPDGEAVQAVQSEGTSVEIGTVIVMSLSREQVVLAADSRASLVDMRNRTFVGVDDSACKVVEAGPSLLFAATGMAKTDQTFPANIYYDAIELARQAAQNFEFDPHWMEKNQTIREIAAKWAWDVAFRINRGVRTGWYPPVRSTWVTGVFAGLEPNGDVSVAIARLDYRQPRPGWIVPPVSISVAVPVPPKDFTWLEAFGRKDVATRYYFRREITDETRVEHRHIRAEQLRNPRHFSPGVVKKLVELTLEKDELEWPDGSKLVGGDIDIARLARGGRVEWLHRKQVCSSATAQ